MSWARLDDGFDSHDKILALRTDQRRYTWIRILIFTARRNDPTVPPTVREIIPKATPTFIRDCIDIGLLDEHQGTLAVHDWNDYNIPRIEKTELDRRAEEIVKANPEASANDLARAIGGRRKQALEAVRRARGGSRMVPEVVPQLVPEVVPGTTPEPVPRARARTRPEPVPQPEEPEGPTATAKTPNPEASYDGRNGLAPLDYLDTLDYAQLDA